MVSELFNLSIGLPLVRAEFIIGKLFSGTEVVVVGELSERANVGIVDRKDRRIIPDGVSKTFQGEGVTVNLGFTFSGLERSDGNRVLEVSKVSVRLRATHWDELEFFLFKKIL
jgi:hypothetical protein